jgi:kinetochore protein NNF1
VHAQMVDRLREAARADFGVILEERGVLGRLNELEVLIGEARGRRDRGEEGGGVGDVA